MAFTEAEKVDIRRFCGYPVRGALPSQMFGYRYFQWYGTLEYYLNNLSTEEEEVVKTIHLPNLRLLEQALVTASDNLDTDRAAVWYHNKNEVRDRYDLFFRECIRLAYFLGLPEGDYFPKKSCRVVV